MKHTRTFVCYAWLALVMMFAVTSCSMPGKGSSTDQLNDAFTRIFSPYLVLDLNSGTLEGRATIADLETNDIYRDRYVVFRRVAGGAVTLGAPAGTFGAGIDVAATTTNLNPYYLAVFEITQGQWQRLAGTTPWTTLSIIPSGSMGSLATDNNNPAFGLSVETVTTTLQSHNVGKSYALDLPTDAQWECACRSGASTPFWWGADVNSRSLALANAQVLETNGGALGPSHVGSKQPNPFGLYDMQGNVWELTHTHLTTSIRGGCWHEPLAQARAANTVTFDRGTAHALVGARLVLAP